MCIPDIGLVILCVEPAGPVVGLLADPEGRARMGVGARERVVGRFDWANRSRLTEALFRRWLAVEVLEPAIP